MSSYYPTQYFYHKSNLILKMHQKVFLKTVRNLENLKKTLQKAFAGCSFANRLSALSISCGWVSGEKSFLSVVVLTPAGWTSA